jgi:hypothetical protein
MGLKKVSFKKNESIILKTCYNRYISFGKIKKIVTKSSAMDTEIFIFEEVSDNLYKIKTSKDSYLIFNKNNELSIHYNYISDCVFSISYLKDDKISIFTNDNYYLTSKENIGKEWEIKLEYKEKITKNEEFEVFVLPDKSTQPVLPITKIGKGFIEQNVLDYIFEVSVRESKYSKELREITEKHKLAKMRAQE